MRGVSSRHVLTCLLTGNTTTGNDPTLSCMAGIKRINGSTGPGPLLCFMWGYGLNPLKERDLFGIIIPYCVNKLTFVKVIFYNALIVKKLCCFNKLSVNYFSVACSVIM